MTATIFVYFKLKQPHTIHNEVWDRIPFHTNLLSVLVPIVKPIKLFTTMIHFITIQTVSNDKVVDSFDIAPVNIDSTEDKINIINSLSRYCAARNKAYKRINSHKNCVAVLKPATIIGTSIACNNIDDLTDKVIANYNNDIAEHNTIVRRANKMYSINDDSKYIPRLELADVIKSVGLPYDNCYNDGVNTIIDVQKI